MKNTVRRTPLCALYVLFLFAGLHAIAQAPAAKPDPDLLVFTNGDQLTGTFERIVSGSVVFKSDQVGEVTVPIAKIKQLRAAGQFAVLRSDTPVTKQQVTPKPIEVTGGDFKAGSETVPAKDLGYVIDEGTYHKETKAHPGFLYGWNGSVNGGATLVRATQYGDTLTAGIALTRTVPTVSFLPPRDRSTFGLTETYGILTQPAVAATETPYSQVKTSIFHTGFEQDKYVSSRMYLLGVLSYDHNYSQGLSLQQIYGVGVGWTPVLTPKQQLDVRTDIHFERQSFIQIPPATATPALNLVGLTIAENYTRHLPGKLLFTESGSFLPAFNDTSAWSANFAAGLVLPVWHRLGVNFSLTDSYLNEPPVGFNNNSFQFVTGVTYALK